MYNSKAEVSLAVHRVGRTTLLDDLDIPSLLLYASEVTFLIHTDINILIHKYFKVIFFLKIDCG